MLCQELLDVLFNHVVGNIQNVDAHICAIHFVGAVMSGAAYGNDEHDEYIDNLDCLGYVDITGII